MEHVAGMTEGDTGCYEDTVYPVKQRNFQIQDKVIVPVCYFYSWLFAHTPFILEVFNGGLICASTILQNLPPLGHRMMGSSKPDQQVKWGQWQ